MTNIYSSISPALSHDFCLSFSQEESSFSSRPRVVLLGEIHYLDNNYFSNTYLIQKLYRPGDVVLVEQVEGAAHFEAYLKERLLQKEIYEIRGWDDLESDNAIKKEKWKVYNFLEEIKDKEIYEEEWDERAKEIFNNFDIDKVPLLDKEERTNIKKIFASLEKAKPEEKKEALTLFLESIPYCLWTSYARNCKQILLDTCIARQRSLALKISEYVKEDNTVFVIAGKAHLLTFKEEIRLDELRSNSTQFLEQFSGKSAEEEDEEEKVQSEGVKLLRDHLSQKKLSFHIFETEGRYSNKMQNVRKALGQPLQGDPLKREKTKSSFLKDTLSFIISKIKTITLLFLSLFKTFYKGFKNRF